MMVISVRSPGRRRGREDKKKDARDTEGTEIVLPGLTFPAQKYFSSSQRQCHSRVRSLVHRRRQQGQIL